MVGFSLLFFIAVFTSNSIYFSDFIEWSKNAQGLPILCAGFLVCLVSGLMLFGFNLSGDSAFGVSLHALFVFVSVGVFLFRLGIPLMNESGLFLKVYEQNMIGAIIVAFTLKHSINAVRTNQHFIWLSSVLYASAGLGLFSVLLGAEQSLPLFYLLALSFLFTFTFVGQSFLETKFSNKFNILFGMVAILGMPPLILGEQYFQLFHHLMDNGLIVIAFGFGTGWFLLSFASLQMLGRVILVKNGIATYRKTSVGEITLLLVYFTGVIALTALKPVLISLLNDRPIPYLW